MSTAIVRPDKDTRGQTVLASNEGQGVITRRKLLQSLSTGALAWAARARRASARATADGPAAGLATVSLCGSPGEVGRRFGQLNAEDIRRHVRHVLDGWRARGLSDGEMIRRAAPFRRFVAKLAPAWEEEIAGCAEAAEVKPELYLAFQAGKYRDLFFVDECTSFLAVGAATADGAALFHKTRDNVTREQCAYQKTIHHASRPAAFHATGDTSDLGLMMMVNEHGLAGSADMGGLPENRPKGRGVMNPHILRLIAERAERCEDALEIVQAMIRDGWYAGGSRTGTHWLFADRFGRGLRVAQNSHEEEHEFFEDDVAFLARGDTAGARIVKRKKGAITLADVNAAASHPSICLTSSISAMTVRVDPARPAEASSVWFALPACAPYVPLFPLAEGVPQAMLDGGCFKRGRAWQELRSRSAPGQGVAFDDPLERLRRDVQEELYVEAARAEGEIEAALARGEKRQAVDLATQATAAGCEKLRRFFQKIERLG
ncbi:MAG: C45 family peptidase [Planctomycetota bacterium]|jgi:hypothetical protein